MVKGMAEFDAQGELQAFAKIIRLAQECAQSPAEAKVPPPGRTTQARKAQGKGIQGTLAFGGARSNGTK